MRFRLHRGGRFRGWLGARLGGDAELGDRAWRRILHLLGSLVVLYYVLPPRFFVVVTTEQALLAALTLMVLFEALRHLAGLELPTIRPWESGRVASFLYFAVALVAAVLLFPRPIGAIVAVGTATIDPLIGELRGSERARWLYPALPIAVYGGIAVAVLSTSYPLWHPFEVAVLGSIAAALAIVGERPKSRWVDDDLLMTLLPAVGLLLASAVWPAGY